MKQGWVLSSGPGGRSTWLPLPRYPLAQANWWGTEQVQSGCLALQFGADGSVTLAWGSSWDPQVGKQLGLAQAAHYCFLNVATTSGCSYKATRSRVYLQLEVKIYNSNHIFHEVQKTCTKYISINKIKALKPTLLVPWMTAEVEVNQF